MTVIICATCKTPYHLVRAERGEILVASCDCALRQEMRKAESEEPRGA